MRIKHLLFIAFITLTLKEGFSQPYPTFGPEVKVTITGLTFDAMEPFISLDGTTLFFNSLNSGGNTNLYYATKVNDSTFNYVGLVGGTYDPSLNHLDGVASIDSLNNFFWVSLRGYPTNMENLHKGVYLDGSLSNITRVYGDFNIYSFNYPFGWVIMDAAINHQGNLLYYCNALFDFNNTTCVGFPCEAKLGMAQKVNDSTYNKPLNSDAIFANVNDANYLVYAPHVTKDGLELYYTRLLKGSVNTEICVSVRNSVSDSFSLPMLIHANSGFGPEAPSSTTDKKSIYYHQKDGSNVYKIFLRYRSHISGITEPFTYGKLNVYPNPSKDIANVSLPSSDTKFEIEIYSSFGQKIYSTSASTSIDISGFTCGVYFLTLKQKDIIRTTKIIKN